MNNPYLLLTPGPLSTTDTVRLAMQKDWCTWDQEYMQLVQKIRRTLVDIATHQRHEYTSVLMQGSGTFTVESVIGSVIRRDSSKLLIATNGAYGDRIIQMANILGIQTVICRTSEKEPTNLHEMEGILQTDRDITHVIVVHCETTTGILNPVEAVCKLAKVYGKKTIVDAMSSFGGIEMDVHESQIDFLISSANKCIQGVPGFGFVIAKKEELEKCEGISHSLSLDLYDQWKTMEELSGKWRFTSPTHIVRAFHQALIELEQEGGVRARSERYAENQQTLVEGMYDLGFESYVERMNQSPIITSFLFPNDRFKFEPFYQHLKQEGFVIYPGKVSKVSTFRIGTIGDVCIQDIERLLQAIKKWEY
jgi:2-aminoethylphosphonate-pyruvate transaminase